MSVLHDIEVRRVNRFTYDLFLGKQWGTWARVRQGRSSTWQMAGEPLPKSLLRELHDVLHPTMPVSYGQTLGQMLFNFHAMENR